MPESARPHARKAFLSWLYSNPGCHARQGGGDAGTSENERRTATAEGADCRACTPRAGRLRCSHVAQARGRRGEEASGAPSGATEIQTPLRGTMDEGGAPLTTGLRRVATVQTCLTARRDPFQCGIRNAECGMNGNGNGERRDPFQCGLRNAECGMNGHDNVRMRNAERKATTTARPLGYARGDSAAAEKRTAGQDRPWHTAD